MFSISVIIPTFNEAENILKVINEIEDGLQGHDYEIIVVDDNSPDGTSDLVKKYSKRNSKVSCIKVILCCCRRRGSVFKRIHLRNGWRWTTQSPRLE